MINHNVIRSGTLAEQNFKGDLSVQDGGLRIESAKLQTFSGSANNSDGNFKKTRNKIKKVVKRPPLHC
jgi:hypothetical protein